MAVFTTHPDMMSSIDFSPPHPSPPHLEKMCSDSELGWTSEEDRLLAEIGDNAEEIWCVPLTMCFLIATLLT
jgi:hypothetical protein